MLEAVHDAMDNGKILNVDFDWVKYVAHFKNQDAGIIVTRQGEWSGKESGNQLFYSVAQGHLSKLL